MQAKSVVLIGAGVWGRKVLKSLLRHSNLQVFVVDRNLNNRKASKLLNFHGEILPSIQCLKSRPDFAFVCTQASSQFDILSELLVRKIPTLVEKPFCLSLEQALKIATEFQRDGVSLHVDHIYLHSKAFEMFQQIIRGLIQESFNYLSRRLDFGSFPKDVDVLDHLLYHDLYIIDALFGLGSIEKVQLFKQGNYSATLLLGDRHGSTFNLSASSLHPEKVRQVSVATEKACVVWNDLDVGREIRSFDFSIPDRKAEIQTIEIPQLPSSLDQLIDNLLSHQPESKSLGQALRVREFIAKARNS